MTRSLQGCDKNDEEVGLSQEGKERSGGSAQIRYFLLSSPPDFTFSSTTRLTFSKASIAGPALMTLKCGILVLGPQAMICEDQEACVTFQSFLWFPIHSVLSSLTYGGNATILLKG